MMNGMIHVTVLVGTEKFSTDLEVNSFWSQLLAFERRRGRLKIPKLRPWTDAGIVWCTFRLLNATSRGDHKEVCLAACWCGFRTPEEIWRDYEAANLLKTTLLETGSAQIVAVCDEIVSRESFSFQVGPVDHPGFDMTPKTLPPCIYIQ